MLSGDWEDSGDGGATLQTRTRSHSELLNLRVFLVFRNQEQSKTVGCGQGCFRCLQSQLDQKTELFSAASERGGNGTVLMTPGSVLSLHAGSASWGPSLCGQLHLYCPSLSRPRAFISLWPICHSEKRVVGIRPGGTLVPNCNPRTWG